MDSSLRKGAMNLLVACGEARPGERVLICCEPTSEGYFDAGLPEVVAEVARDLGCETRFCEVPFDPFARELSSALLFEIGQADLTVFLARIGDQLRFRSFPNGARVIASYVLDRAALASDFARASHAAFLEIKSCVDAFIDAAGGVRASCPQGTDLRGVPEPASDTGDVCLRRFPLSIMRPIAATGFSGRVALPGFLTGTGSMYYEPYSCFFNGPVFAIVESGRLKGFEGSAEDVARAQRHYAQVAERFGIDGAAVDSWHVGLHPGCGFHDRAIDHLERWGGSAFGNPRVLHVHTCGAYAPGEISWNVIDPTVSFDGVTVWDKGVFLAHRVPGMSQILSRYPDVARLFANPVRGIGLDGPVYGHPARLAAE